MTLASSSSLRLPRPASDGAAHHPAAFVLAFGLEIKNALFLELCEGQVPEIQVQDLAFARQKVVFDLQAQHGFEMAAQHCRRDQVGDLRGLVVSGLDVLQRVEADFLAGLLLGLFDVVPLRDFARRGPSSSSRSSRPFSLSSAMSVALRRGSVFRSESGRRRRRRPARRCCRCSSARRRSGRRRAAGGRRCRPGWRCAGGRCARPCWD